MPPNSSSLKCSSELAPSYQFGRHQVVCVHFVSGFQLIDLDSIVYDRDTGKPKGFGFVEYRDKEAAASAVRNLNNKDFRTRSGSVLLITDLRVVPSSRVRYHLISFSCPCPFAEGRTLRVDFAEKSMFHGYDFKGDSGRGGRDERDRDYEHDRRVRCLYYRSENFIRMRNVGLLRKGLSCLGLLPALL